MLSLFFLKAFLDTAAKNKMCSKIKSLLKSSPSLDIWLLPGYKVHTLEKHEKYLRKCMKPRMSPSGVLIYTLLCEPVSQAWYDLQLRIMSQWASSVPQHFIFLMTKHFMCHLTFVMELIEKCSVCVSVCLRVYIHTTHTHIENQCFLN